jgi:hypothetical protein
MDLVDAARQLQAFRQPSLARRLADIECRLRGKDDAVLEDLLAAAGVSGSLFQSALVMKQAAGEINVLVHAIGILSALPRLLEGGEVVQALSLGAGNTGKPFDLETTLRIAEFKFIHWRGGSEVIRQNSLFQDFFYLAEADTSKRRYLYVVGAEHPRRFLAGGRALRSVMSRNATLQREFRDRYGDRFSVVREYYEFRKARVIIEDLRSLLPEFSAVLLADGLDELRD